MNKWLDFLAYQDTQMMGTNEFIGDIMDMKGLSKNLQHGIVGRANNIINKLALIDLKLKEVKLIEEEIDGVARHPGNLGSNMGLNRPWKERLNELITNAASESTQFSVAIWGMKTVLRRISTFVNTMERSGFDSGLVHNPRPEDVYYPNDNDAIENKPSEFSPSGSHDQEVKDESGEIKDKIIDEVTNVLEDRLNERINSVEDEKTGDRVFEKMVNSEKRDHGMSNEKASKQVVDDLTEIGKEEVEIVGDELAKEQSERVEKVQGPRGAAIKKAVKRAEKKLEKNAEQYVDEIIANTENKEHKGRKARKHHAKPAPVEEEPVEEEPVEEEPVEEQPIQDEMPVQAEDKNAPKENRPVEEEPVEEEPVEEEPVEEEPIEEEPQQVVEEPIEEEPTPPTKRNKLPNLNDISAQLKAKKAQRDAEKGKSKKAPKVEEPIEEEPTPAKKQPVTPKPTPPTKRSKLPNLNDISAQLKAKKAQRDAEKGKPNKAPKVPAPVVNKPIEPLKKIQPTKKLPSVDDIIKQAKVLKQKQVKKQAEEHMTPQQIKNANKNMAKENLKEEIAQVTNEEKKLKQNNKKENKEKEQVKAKAQEIEKAVAPVEEKYNEAAKLAKKAEKVKQKQPNNKVVEQAAHVAKQNAKAAKKNLDEVVKASGQAQEQVSKVENNQVKPGAALAKIKRIQKKVERRRF